MPITTKRRILPRSLHVIRRAKRPAFVMLSIDEFEDLIEQANPRIQAEIALARREIEQGKSIPQEVLFQQLGL